MNGISDKDCYFEKLGFMSTSRHSRALGNDGVFILQVSECARLREPQSVGH